MGGTREKRNNKGGAVRAFTNHRQGGSATCPELSKTADTKGAVSSRRSTHESQKTDSVLELNQKGGGGVGEGVFNPNPPVPGRAPDGLLGENFVGERLQSEG